MQGLYTAFRTLILSGLTASVLALTSLSVQAVPEAGDPISRFLQDRFAQDTSASTTSGRSADQLLDGVRQTASDLVLSAMHFLGVRYRFGGTSEETGFDCSGFTRHVFENSVGLLLPRRSSEQANAPGLLNIRQDDLRPGDLVFFNTMRSAFPMSASTSVKENSSTPRAPAAPSASRTCARITGPAVSMAHAVSHN